MASPSTVKIRQIDDQWQVAILPLDRGWVDGIAPTIREAFALARANLDAAARATRHMYSRSSSSLVYYDADLPRIVVDPDPAQEALERATRRG